MADGRSLESPCLVHSTKRENNGSYAQSLLQHANAIYSPEASIAAVRLTLIAVKIGMRMLSSNMQVTVALSILAPKQLGRPFIIHTRNTSVVGQAGMAFYMVI